MTGVVARAAVDHSPRTPDAEYSHDVTADPWPAPMANHAVDAAVSVPGSKSLTNRALVLSALADGPSVIRSALVARDTTLMMEALRRLGAEVRTDPDDNIFVAPATFDRAATVDCGLAGTVMRFVPPAAALTRGEVRFDGDERARARPMSTMIAALRDLGIVVDDGGTGRLPFAVSGRGRVPGGEVTLDASASSQFVSGLLLSGARYDQGIRVRHVGPPVPSLPHIRMTTAMLAEHGVRIRVDDADPGDATWRVDAGPIAALDRTVEPDLSNTAPFLAAAMVTGGRIVIPSWPARGLQPTNLLLAILAEMGGRYELETSSLRLAGPERVHGITVDMRDIGELVPTVTALCCFADSTSRLTGIEHIAGHETDRLAALSTEINALGGSVTRTGDGLLIEPRIMHGGPVRTYDDHRMATAAAILGLRVPGILIENVATTSKTFPGFPGAWEAMLRSRSPLDHRESGA